ncbi:MAG: hypothetical protein LKJ21_01775 [Oscillospiraceae bacterium]|jgi:hypothetical protein|nr:hypothetical protein [Oscillospiraceae bacterium]MCI1990895.1 hypothetical protein [Oscillospiraceae bacterium]MCI2034422.1 hypothetical protein [Oscillospiraceae bacterium]
MVISISRPDLLTIADEETARSFFGGAQDWYSAEWSRRAGCGPTCAANILAYLAFSRPGLSSLYRPETRNRPDFVRHMEEVYRFVTPGSMGLNRVEMFSDGVAAFARSRGVSLHPHVFRVPGNRAKDRPDVSALAEFIRAGLACDCPLGFLNLTRGRVKNLQGWHWLTVTAAEIGKDNIFVRASDEGRPIRLDLRLWYLTTRMSGGLAYFTV